MKKRIIKVPVVFCLLILLLPVLSIAADTWDGGYLPSMLLLRSSPHDRITIWQGTKTCLQCHLQEAEQVFASVHYQWEGDAPFMLNRPDLRQGKFESGLNSYCINITGNWATCNNCHAGLGLTPEALQSQEQLENIDCLLCHQKNYMRKAVDGLYVPDLERMGISMLQAARTVHLPGRVNCLQCHAPAGGGDNYKRGDLTGAHGGTTDRNFDVHMALTGADLRCQGCSVEHRMAGKGSDLRPTDLDVAVVGKNRRSPISWRTSVRSPISPSTG